MADFLAFGDNASVPIDFVSSHFYPAPGERDGLAAALSATTNATASHGGRAALPVVISEFNSGLRIGCCHDDPYAAAYLVYTLGQVQRHATRGVASLMYWCFSDVFEENRPVDTNADRPPFHNAFGLQTMQGIKKPAFRALELLASFPNATLPSIRTLGNGSVHEASHVDAYAGIQAAPPLHGGGPSSHGTNISVMVSNWVPTLLPSRSPHVAIEVTVPSAVRGLVSGRGVVCTATITRVPDPKAVWRSMGAPTRLTATQLQQLELATVLAPAQVGCTVVADGAHGGATARVLAQMPAQAAAMISFMLK